MIFPNTDRTILNGRHALEEEFALDDTLTQIASAFPPARRTMNHMVREYLSLGA